jgi:hypothetical protein
MCEEFLTPRGHERHLRYTLRQAESEQFLPDGQRGLELEGAREARRRTDLIVHQSRRFLDRSIKQRISAWWRSDGETSRLTGPVCLDASDKNDCNVPWRRHPGARNQ